MYCCGTGDGYTGHYILVCGYDSERGDFIVHDPASSRPTQHIPGGSLEEARKCFGTDEDLLLVAAKRLDDRVIERVLGQLIPAQ